MTNHQEELGFPVNVPLRRLYDGRTPRQVVGALFPDNLLQASKEQFQQGKGNARHQQGYDSAGRRRQQPALDLSYDPGQIVPASAPPAAPAVTHGVLPGGRRSRTADGHPPRPDTVCMPLNSQRGIAQMVLLHGSRHVGLTNATGEEQ